jgi:hypothetical protein
MRSVYARCRIRRVLLAGCLWALPIASKDCDIVVSLFDYSGKPTDTVVSLLDSKGSPIQTTVSTNGRAEFCDAGLAPVTIAVGLDICGQVLIRRIEPSARHTQSFPVYYRSCHSFFVPNGCDVVVRVRDLGARPISRAIVSAGVLKVLTDDFGRASVRMSCCKSTEATVKKDGFGPRQVEIECKHDGQAYETVVFLERLGRGQ